MTNPCEHCQGEADPDTTCPWSLACPRCRVKPGQRCKRPSGHAGNFVPMHADRIAAAERADDLARAAWTRDPAKRAEAGLPQLYEGIQLGFEDQ